MIGGGSLNLKVAVKAVDIFCEADARSAEGICRGSACSRR